MARAGNDLWVARGEDGAIRIATSRDGGGLDPGFSGAVLDVAGAVLGWPVLGGAGVPGAEVDDVGRAQEWLWAVYGEPVAAAVRACATGEAASVRVSAEGTALAGAAGRLAFGHWASRWWPASYADGIPALEPNLLGLELAALTHQCQQLFGDFDDFGDQPDDCAAELIADHRAALDPLVQWWRAAPQPADTARQLEYVLRLIDDAADSAGLDGPELRRLRAALEGDLEANRTPQGPAALFARHPGYALAAGEPRLTPGRLIARGSGTNDWRRYPPGFVDAAESAVSWTARALGGRRQIEVEVVAHVAAPVGGAPLVAEVRVNGGPPDRVPLTRRDDLWTGRADLDLDRHLPGGPTPPRFDVAVLLSGFDPGPDPGPGPEAHAARGAIRALVRRRLATAAPDARPYDTPPHDTPPYDPSSRPFLAEIAAAATSEDY